MFTPIHLLRQHTQEGEEARCRDRWRSPAGTALHKHILKRIKDGAGEDFLFEDFENGRLGFLEWQQDLRGFDLRREDITFPLDDNFEAIDFSYARWNDCTFRNALFTCRFSFARLHNCEFRDCTFTFSGFFGARLEQVRFVNCLFIEGNGFMNSDLVAVEFTNCFHNEDLFSDCRFDAQTTIGDSLETLPGPGNDNRRRDPARLAALYRGIKDAYGAGDVSERSRAYFLKQMEAVTRYNTPTAKRRVWGYFWEYIAGYGVRPFRVLRAMVVAFCISFTIFGLRLGLAKGLLVSAGAFFTFGAGSDFLQDMCIGYKVAYILTAFSGVGLTALFVTVLANVWLRER